MGRRYRQYANFPLPTPEDRLWFLLKYLKQAPTQVLHARPLGWPVERQRVDPHLVGSPGTPVVGYEVL
jgi:hypothetical protein